MRAGRLTVENYRGVPVPRTLGLLIALAALGSTGVIALTGRPAPVTRAGWGALGATALVFAAGLIDDLAPAGPRGLRNHLRDLAAGHVSTGIVKVVVIVAAAVIVIASNRVGRVGPGLRGPYWSPRVPTCGMASTCVRAGRSSSDSSRPSASSGWIRPVAHAPGRRARIGGGPLVRPA